MTNENKPERCASPLCSVSPIAHDRTPSCPAKIPDAGSEDRCPQCGNRSDYCWPWCSPTGEGWGRCLQCDTPSRERQRFDWLEARVARLEKEDIEATAILAEFDSGHIALARREYGGSMWTIMTTNSTRQPVKGFRAAVLAACPNARSKVEGEGSE